MKFFLVALTVIAVSHASTTVYLSPPTLKLASPLAWSPSLALAQAPLTLAAPSSLGLAPAQLTYAAPGPLALAPLAIKYIAQPQILAAPAIQPGYVAATRGSLHIAPLPGNTPLASHHLNLEPAPGTL